MEFALRLCQPGDERGVSLVAQATILETYADLSNGSDLYTYVTDQLNVEKIRDFLKSDGVKVWALETVPEKCIVGYALLLFNAPSQPVSVAELDRLYVFHRFQRMGLGRRLMDEVLADARSNGSKKIMLRVNARNYGAIEFYKRFGFTIVSEQAFRAGERDYRVLVMELAL